MNTYKKIRFEQSNISAEKFGVFFAFNQEQFKEGVKACGYKKGDRIVRWVAGAFGSVKAITAYSDALEAYNTRIKQECTPEEIFEAEFWNHESGLFGNIDLPAAIAREYFPDWRPTEELYRRLMREFRELNG
jgi:hypothetical protein